VDGGMFQNSRRLAQFDEEGALAAQDVVIGPQAGEEAIDWGQLELLAGHERAHLGQNDT